jgi:hypothetical protein
MVQWGRLFQLSWMGMADSMCWMKRSSSNENDLSSFQGIARRTRGTSVLLAVNCLLISLLGESFSCFKPLFIPTLLSCNQQLNFYCTVPMHASHHLAS